MRRNNLLFIGFSKGKTVQDMHACLLLFMWFAESSPWGLFQKFANIYGDYLNRPHRTLIFRFITHDLNQGIITSSSVRQMIQVAYNLL